MPITHATIPVPPAQVGQTHWAEAHTLPTPAEIGALTTASADALYLTSASASTVYARQTSAVTTAQLAVYILAQDASTTYARQASAVTTAQLGVYLLAQDASTTYARQASAVTTAQLSVYLTSGSAAAIYLTQSSANSQFANLASAVTTAGLNTALVPYLTSGSAAFTHGRTYFVATNVINATTVVTTLNDLIVTCSASTVYSLEGHLLWRSSAGTTGITVLCSTTPNPSLYSFGVQIYGAAPDGLGAVWAGFASANADPITNTSANAAGITIPIIVNGTFVANNSTMFIQLCFASEVSNSGAVIQRGSWVRAVRIGTL